MTGAPAASIAVIPARGGSKRIPRKNVRLFGGRPLISWPIDTCLASGLFTDVVVTTDDEEIAEIARSYGAMTPFRRPDRLAGDTSTTGAVLAHAAAEMLRLEPSLSTICCVYPAAAFITADDLAASLELLSRSPEVDYAASVVRFSHPVQRAMVIDGTQRISLLDPSVAEVRTQDLEPRFHDAGQFYWGRVDAWRDQVPMFGSAVAYEIPSWRAHDIDNEDDWRRAELAFAVLHPETR